jgi:hypothetical protein
MSYMSCGVCCVAFTRVIRKPLKCDNCDFIVCCECIKTYLLTVDRYQCMNCFVGWSNVFLDENLPKTYINKKLLPHAAKDVIIREKSLLPATIEKKKKEKKVRELKELKREMNVQIININHEISEIYNDIAHPSGKKLYIKICPVTGCNGYINIDDNTCGLCDIIVCPKCDNIMKDNHICLESDIKTLELTGKDSKLCPNCKILIYKISGCDNMFCTMCKSGFNWSTGKIIERRRLENPHYYEYLRQNNIEIQRNEEQGAVGGEPACGGPAQPEIQIGLILRKINLINPEKLTYYENVHSFLITFEHTTIHNQMYESPILDNSFKYERLREHFIDNIITEDKWISSLVSIIRHNKRCEYILNFNLQMYDNLFEILMKLTLISTEKELKIIYSELENLRMNYNYKYEEIMKFFNSRSIYYISEKWEEYKKKVFPVKKKAQITESIETPQNEGDIVTPQNEGDIVTPQNEEDIVTPQNEEDIETLDGDIEEFSDVDSYIDS